MEAAPYYRKHLFFCTRLRSNDRCCMNSQTELAQQHADELVRALEMKGKGHVRVSFTGCLGRCDEGPVVVVYPEGRWYTYRNKEDVDEIIRSDIINNEIVTRLKI